MEIVTANADRVANMDVQVRIVSDRVAIVLHATYRKERSPPFSVMKEDLPIGMTESDHRGLPMSSPMTPSIISLDEELR